MGDKLSWRTSGYERALIQASSSYSGPMQLKYATGTASSPQVMIGHKGRCLHFSQDGIAQLALESYCQPISATIVRPVQWRDVAGKEECPSSLLKGFVKKVGDDMKNSNNIHATDWIDTAW
ncbi:hypothetical protein N7447_003531 [Penicillium robsamsonii]|uniref:uncharacterized protein n=1 Tax=Penicillium robsamsonii TaxID=1792511 RepID=UPI002548A4EF|nr:uncharacterized protein N7447_003531 [Penicillium robsamsonii]KAJ5826768.1 hypothetical protein N7447_003531 [Penicillium robsamsonii]